MQQTLKLCGGELTVTVDLNGGSIEQQGFGDNHDPKVEVFTSFVLALACEGYDIEDARFRRAAQTVVDWQLNQE